jgi:alkylated DNA repair dioxygenase AlkB
VTLPDGFIYQPEFLNQAEETRLIRIIAELPLAEMRYKQYTAKRRIVSYGSSYDFSDNELRPAASVPEFLQDLRARAAQWIGISPDEFQHVLVAEYRPGTQLGWHRDVPDFELVVGISLESECRMRLRPYPPAKGKDPRAVAIELAPRSAYLIRGDARWNWQHAISPTKTRRYSITFRTRSHRRR